MQPHKLAPKRQQRAEFLAEGVGNKKTKTRETDRARKWPRAIRNPIALSRKNCIQPLPLTVARDASDPPRADRSPLGTPPQPLRHPRVGRPIVRVCASSTVHHRAPGFSDSLGFSITLPMPMSPGTLKASVLPNTSGVPRHGHALRPGRPHVKGIGHQVFTIVHFR